ncbi:hypothetical protein [Jutongia sp.]|mgnify:FL=1|jgi:hypothetical protein|uniref:hypothetical protein n=1 Tax=Jutongia sp. TaxID=2944204 RepID=UPI00307AE92B
MMEFEEAKKDLLDNPKNANYWAIKLQQYPAAFMKTAIDAIQLSGKLIEEWLGTCMFDKNNSDDQRIIKEIVSKLNEHDDSKIHGRHLNVEFCKNIGLKVFMMEQDGELQDKILSLHHAYMLTLDGTPSIKIIENQNRKSVITNMQIMAR